jgi:hypothetical protein
MLILEQVEGVAAGCAFAYIESRALVNARDGISLGFIIINIQYQNIRHASLPHGGGDQ